MKDILDFECCNCGFFDFDYGACTCPSYELWYACPIESSKPENQRELEEFAKKEFENVAYKR